MTSARAGLVREPLVLLSRAYCSLCDTMQQEAAPVAVAHGTRLEVIDVDADPELAQRWGDLVPVLFLGDPDPAHELCHYHFDARQVAAALAAATMKRASVPNAGRGVP